MNTTLETIVILYWRGRQFSDLSYENNTELVYNENNRNEVIDTVLGQGYNLLFKQDVKEKILYIFISNGNFSQC